MSTPTTVASTQGRPSYGIDAPPVIAVFFAIGAVLMGIAVALLPSVTGYVVAALAMYSLLTSALFVLYALFGKFRYRRVMLAMVNWKGHEQVLDVGCGRGFLLAGAAKLLTTGKAFGIDIWSNEDLSRNSIDNCRRNLQCEGVSNRTEVRSDDARKLSFDDASFDVIVSNLCLHNIHPAAERDKACREIARVLKVGGVALISDFKNTEDYARIFEAEGLKVSFGPRYWLSILAPFPLRVVQARKT